ncbi:hypothetical protein IW147_004690 [Coemansia sp. RSA 720]|nr:hypothetical protein IW147_004690 [Coemansia sp. RSA 720]
MAEELVFDLQKYRGLAAADREVFLFSWLSRLEALLSTGQVTQDELKGRQEQLEQVLLEIATIPSSAQARTHKRTWLRTTATDSVAELLGAVPKPSRVTREHVASVLALMYEFGQMHQMGDTLYAVQASMQSRAGSRIAAMTCAGVLFERLGQRAGFRLLSCFNDFVAIGVRVATGNVEGEKMEALRMLGRLIAGGSKVLGEQQAREIMRAARANLAHRSPLVAVAAGAVVQALARVPGRCDAADVVCTQTVALLNTRVLVVRRALARTVAVVVARTTVANIAARENSVRDSSETTSRAPRASTASVQVQATGTLVASEAPIDTSHTPPLSTVSSPRLGDSRQWTLGRALQRLAQPFVRGTRDQRLGIADAYTMLFEELDSTIVELQYDELVAHIVALATDVPAGIERRGTCGICSRILRSVHKALNADGRANASRVLWERWLRTDALRDDVAVLVLSEFAPLLQDTHVDWKDNVPVERWLVHSEERVRVAAALCVRTAAQHDSTCVPGLLSALVSRLQHASAQSATAQGALAQGTDSACLGYSCGVAAVLGAASCADGGLLGVPLDAIEWVHGIAVRLLHAAYGRRDAAVIGSLSEAAADPAGVMPVIGVAELPQSHVRRTNKRPDSSYGLALRNVQMQSGWMLLAGVAAVLGASVTQPRRSQWQQLWAHAMPATFIASTMPWLERRHLLQSRVLALTHVRMCLRSRALAADVMQLAPMLRATLLFADNALDAPTHTRDGASELGELHMLVRACALECLELLEARELAACASVVQPALRLAEQAIAARESLGDVFAAQMSRAVVLGETASPAPTTRRSAWAYETDAGVTSLLASCVDEDDEDDEMLRELDWARVVHGDAAGACVATRVVDASVQLTGRVFPYLGESQQLSVLDALVTQLNLLPFNGHRHMAVLTNMVVMTYVAVRSGAAVTMRVARSVVETARAALMAPIPRVRQLAGEVIGRLAAATDASMYVPFLLDQLSALAIRSRDRFARAGAAVALGALYARAGSIAAGSGSLKQVVAMLHSLASDRDPIVHTWALGALSEAAASAGYMFAPYARDTLLMCQKLVLSDAHTAPFAASSLWVRGREHAASSIWDCASIERTHVRVATGKVAVAWECAVVHPNSSAYHGRAPDDGRESGDHSSAYAFVCAPNDVDSVDARASLGRLLCSLLLVLGPELQVDTEASARVGLLLAELRCALPSIAGDPAFSDQMDPALASMDPASAFASVDPDARWESVAELIHATQRQLLFCFPRDPTFVPRFMSQVLRPCVRVRRIMYHGHADILGLCGLHRAAVRALDSVLRLYGDRISETMDETENALLICDVVWEALWLHSSLDGEQSCGDVQRLVRTAVSGCVAHGLSGTHALAMTETLCAAFTKRASTRIPELKSARRPDPANTEIVIDAARQFGAPTKQLVVAALLAVLDTEDTQSRVESGWRVHPLLSLLPDLLRVAHAASAVEEEPDLCILGLHLVRRVLEQFSNVEDPAMQGDRVLLVHQAQISSSFMSKLGSTDCAVRVRVAAVGVAAAYVVSGLVVDRGSMVRVLRLLAPQPAFDALPFARTNRASRSRSLSVTSADEALEVETPQLHVIVRLAILDAWSTIAEYAHKHSAVLRDVVDVHMSLLARMWLGAVRDAAAVCNQSTTGHDVFGELDVPEGGLDRGLGLVLGLEAAYVPMVREELSAWYRHYLPQTVRSVSRLLVESSPVREYLQRSEKLALHGQAAQMPQAPRLVVLLLCFAVQELRRMTSPSTANTSTCVPFVQRARERLIGSLDVGDDAAVTGFASEMSELIITLHAMVAADYHLESVFVATASPHTVSWLVDEMWTQAVSIPLRTNVASEASLELATAVLDKLIACDLFDVWVFTDTQSDADDWLQSLSVFGRTVVRDAVSVWDRARGNNVEMTARALSVLARVLGRVQCKTGVLVWMSLWQQSLGGDLSCADHAAASLAEFVRMQLGSIDVANSVLAQMLHDYRVAALSITAHLLARPDLGFTVSPQVTSLFNSVFVACVKDAPSMSSAETTALLYVPELLAANEAAARELTGLARESIPQLARLVYDPNAAHLMSQVLTALVHFASSAKYSANGSVVMATILMLFLSMVDTKVSVHVSEAILSLAAVDPVLFKSIVVRLSASHPQAKQRLESAVRSRAAAPVRSASEDEVVGDKEAAGIMLKSDFSI